MLFILVNNNKKIKYITSEYSFNVYAMVAKWNNLYKMKKLYCMGIFKTIVKLKTAGCLHLYMDEFIEISR